MFEQKKVIEEIAALGKDRMIVGRNADIILRECHVQPFCKRQQGGKNKALHGARDACHLTVNTTNWEIEELVPAVADFAARWFGGRK